MTQPTPDSVADPYPEPSKATTSLVLGILALIMCGVLAPFAWVTANRELEAINNGRRPPSGRGMANAGKVLGIVGTAFLAVTTLVLVLLAIGALTLSTLTLSAFDDANRDDSGAIVAEGDLDVMSLQVGDCFNDPEDLEEVVFDVAAVPCTGPHDNEVFAVQPLGAAFGDSYPGDDALSDYTYEVCSGALFDSYVGTAYADSSLEVFTFTPTQESWSEGDREFVCALFRLDFAKLTSTARESGL